ncbi:(2Fe-2S) ferredoxin domain-containing protein [Stomatohabitans albus]|uniref:(2Fe-2S) ferredoxin domain-containing protein n=1 Tax=Stomatohabitans albus TaxID=3110766 RepID=UPI00300DAC39
MVALAHTDALDLVELYKVVQPYGLRVAALQSGRPTLVSVLDELVVANPVRPIHLIGYTRTGSGPARSWLKRVAGHWLRSHPDTPVYVSTELVHDCDAQQIALARRAKVRPVTGAEAGLENPTWEEPPPHKAHLLICQGPRCLAKGAREVADHLYSHLNDAGIAEDCLIALTGCLYPCNHAPVVCVQPYQTWMRGDPDDLDSTASKVKTIISNNIQYHNDKERSYHD